LGAHAPQPLKQLELALELIVGRIGSDFTPARFQACYRDFMQGLEWTAESSMTDLGRRYAAAFAEVYSPFMQQHDYILEHYLVSYVHRTLFPLGAQESSRGLSAGQSARSIREQCLLMLTHYAVIQTLLIGLSAFYKTEFSAAHAIQAIQSFAKTFEHSIHFPAQTFRKLQEQDITSAAGLAILLRN
jgi:lysine-N-methylase